MKLTDPSIQVINEIKSNDLLWVVRGGVDYKIYGSSLISQFSSILESEIFSNNINPSNTIEMGIGSAAIVDSAILYYKIKRGNRRCTGQLNICCNGTDISYVTTNVVTLPDTGEETGGATINAKIESGQIYVVIETDGLDSELTNFKAKVKIL